MNYAVVNEATGEVENTTVWDGLTDWSPGPGYIAVAIPADSSASIGWTYADEQFVPPEPPQQED